jgi:hypothetical protein
MAILPGVPYVRVCINSTNGNLKEHPDPDGPLPREPGQPRQNKMSIYVESKSSAAFRFEYFVMQKRIPKNTCLAFYAIIDGHRTSSMTICNEDGFKPKQWTHVLKGDRIRKPDGTMNMRGFEFAEINTGGLACCYVLVLSYYGLSFLSFKYFLRHLAMPRVLPSVC